MRWQAVALRMALIVAGIALPLAVLEVALRVIDAPVEIYNPLNGFHVGDARLGWRPRANVERRFRKLAFDSVVRHGADGFRAPAPAPDPSATRHVLVLGDSYAWGWGVSQGELVSDHLQRALAPGTAILNRGVNAYGTAQELLLLEDELARRTFDTVVLLFCINDFGDNVDRKPQRPRFVRRDGHLVPENLPLPDRLKGAFEEWFDENSRASNFLSYQFALAKARWRRSSSDNGPGVASTTASRTDEEPPGREMTRQLLLAMAERVRAAGADFVVVFVALPNDLSKDLGAHAVEAARFALASIADEAGARFVDLTDAFAGASGRGEELFIVGDGHWSAQGHALAARELAPILAPASR